MSKNDIKVYKRESDGRFVANVYYKIEGQKSKRLTASAVKMKDAKSKLNVKIKALEAKLSKEAAIAADTKPHYTFVQVAREWLPYHAKLKKLEESTVQAYVLTINSVFDRYMNDMLIEDMDVNYLDDFLQDHIGRISESSKKPISVNTVKKWQIVIRQVFKFALKREYISSNPAVLMDVLSSTAPPKPRILTHEEFMDLWDAVKGTVDEIPVLLGSTMGLRRSEIFGLKWNDIDYRKKELTVRKAKVRVTTVVEKTPKNATSYRTVDMFDFVIDALKAYQVREGLFVGPVITKYKVGYYSQRFPMILKKLNLPKVKLHELRHFCATMMLLNGIDVVTVAALLGHSNTTTTQELYQHVIKLIRQRTTGTMGNFYLSGDIVDQLNAQSN